MLYIKLIVAPPVPFCAYRSASLPRPSSPAASFEPTFGLPPGPTPRAIGALVRRPVAAEMMDYLADMQFGQGDEQDNIDGKKKEEEVQAGDEQKEQEEKPENDEPGKATTYDIQASSERNGVEAPGERRADQLEAGAPAAHLEAPRSRDGRRRRLRRRRTT